MIDPQNIDTEEVRDFDTDGVFVHARFRASLAVVVSREELMDNPQALTEARRKAINALSENPDAYSVGAGARAVRIPAKDLP